MNVYEIAVPVGANGHATFTVKAARFGFDASGISFYNDKDHLIGRVINIPGLIVAEQK